jgi:hypothetical protein
VRLELTRSLDVFTEYGITRNPKRSYLHPNALVIQEDRWQLLSAVEMYVLGTPYCIARANCSGDNFIYAPTGLECLCRSFAGLATAAYAASEGLRSQETSVEAMGSPLFVDDGGRTWFAPISGGLYVLENGAARRTDVPGPNK